MEGTQGVGDPRTSDYPVCSLPATLDETVNNPGRHAEHYLQGKAAHSLLSPGSVGYCDIRHTAGGVGVKL